MYVPQCALEWLRHPNHPQLDLKLVPTWSFYTGVGGISLPTGLKRSSAEGRPCFTVRSEEPGSSSGVGAKSNPRFPATLPCSNRPEYMHLLIRSIPAGAVPGPVLRPCGPRRQSWVPAVTKLTGWREKHALNHLTRQYTIAAGRAAGTPLDGCPRKGPEAGWRQRKQRVQLRAPLRERTGQAQGSRGGASAGEWGRGSPTILSRGDWAHTGAPDNRSSPHKREVYRNTPASFSSSQHHGGPRASYEILTSQNSGYRNDDMADVCRARGAQGSPEGQTQREATAHLL